MKPFFVILLLGLSACQTGQDADKLFLPEMPPHQLSPEDEWTQTNAEYSMSLHRASVYAQECGRSITMVRLGCKDVVRQLNEIDQQAEEAQDRGFQGLTTHDYSVVGDAMDDLKAAGELIDEMIPEEN